NISGQNNSLGKVTSQKMSENKMEYRGSKSNILNRLPQPNDLNFFVKEQRVDGSYFVKQNICKKLRCTLMVGENSHQVKTLSKGLNNKNFSTLTQNGLPCLPKILLNPWFVSGLIDGLRTEGTFSISIRKDKEYKLGWQIGAEFQIQLHERDLNLLLQLKEFFSGIGTISIGKTRKRVTYSVKSIKDITQSIIPHFLKYTLLTQKAADFILFIKIVELIRLKAHLTNEGLQKIVNIKASLNLGIPRVRGKI
uniref:LAGLIDADG homing endonuclease n=1 Tax=Elmerina hispida TaxID=1245649 RepID=UPI003002FF64